MNAAEIKSLLSDRVEDFCHSWLAGGRRHNSEWRCGDIYGAAPAAGKTGSFVVPLAGKYVGTFYENDQGAAVRKGSLVDIIMHQRNAPFVEALKLAADWLGVRTDRPDDGWRRASLPGLPVNPVRPVKDWTAIESGDPAAIYLTEERGIDLDIAQAYRVGMAQAWFGQTKKDVPAMAFPAYDATGKDLLMVKYIAIDRGPNGEKYVRANKGAEYHLIGMDAAERARAQHGAMPLVITEGEIDMLTHARFKFAAVSVPFGAKADGEDGKPNAGNAWIQHDWDWLETWDDIIIALDGDETGQRAAQTLLKRLGPERCRIARFPDDPEKKDANSLVEFDPDEYLRVMDGAQPVDPDALRRASAFRDDIWNEFFPSDEAAAGTVCPWDGSGNFPFRFRKGEMTAWQGYTKHGKTTLLNYCLVHFASLNQRCCIASLEIKAAKTLRTIMRMGIGSSRPANHVTHEPDKPLFDRAMRWMEDRFWIYDKVGEPTIDEVLKVWRYAARRYDVQHFVLDSLMKVDVNEEDYPAVKSILNALTAFAREYDVHVHLVTHSKKPTEKRPEAKYWPDKYQISGSASISNIPHNVVCVYRNLAKEQKVEQLIAQWQTAKDGGSTATTLAEMEAEIDAHERQHDALFVVQAQREGDGSLPIIQLFFDKGHSWQYFRARDDSPAVFINRK